MSLILILPAVHRDKTGEPWPTADWNSSERCADCRLPKLTEDFYGFSDNILFLYSVDTNSMERNHPCEADGCSRLLPAVCDPKVYCRVVKRPQEIFTLSYFSSFYKPHSIWPFGPGNGYLNSSTSCI